MNKNVCVSYNLNKVIQYIHSVWVSGDNDNNL